MGEELLLGVWSVSHATNATALGRTYKWRPLMKKGVGLVGSNGYVAAKKL